MESKTSNSDATKILLVDDTPANIDVLRKTLAPHGYNISMAPNGEIALKIAPAFMPDLILLDVMMPGINGFETATKLKENPITCQIPIIFITAKTETQDIIEGFKVGGVDYINKPFRQEEVIARVQAHLKIQTLLRVRERLIDELKCKNHDLTGLNELKNKFLGMAAHDLRGPLSAINGFSDLLLKCNDSLTEEERSEFITCINQSSENMLNLVSNLLDISVIESGHLVLNLQECSLGKLIDERVHINKIIADKKNINIHKQSTNDITACIDASQVAQVLDNLIGNAIKFSQQGTNIYVKMDVEDGKAKVSVQDEGPGIPLEEQSILFQGFQKTSVRPTGGEKSTGLGLAIIKKIVEAHHGNIGLISQPGHGSIFYFTLPMA